MMSVSAEFLSFSFSLFFIETHEGKGEVSIRERALLDRPSAFFSVFDFPRKKKGVLACLLLKGKNNALLSQRSQAPCAPSPTLLGASNRTVRKISHASSLLGAWEAPDRGQRGTQGAKVSRREMEKARGATSKFAASERGRGRVLRPSAISLCLSRLFLSPVAARIARLPRLPHSCARLSLSTAISPPETPGRAAGQQR